MLEQEKANWEAAEEDHIAASNKASDKGCEENISGSQSIIASLSESQTRVELSQANKDEINQVVVALNENVELMHQIYNKAGELFPSKYDTTGDAIHSLVLQVETGYLMAQKVLEQIK